MSLKHLCFRIQDLRPLIDITVLCVFFDIFLFKGYKLGIVTYIYLFILAWSHAIITPGRANLEFWRIKQNKKQENIISPLGAPNTQLSFLASIMEISKQMQTEKEKFSMNKKFQDHYLKIGVKIRENDREIIVAVMLLWLKC